MADEKSWEKKFKSLRQDYMALEKQLNTQQKSVEPLTHVTKVLSVAMQGDDEQLDQHLEKLYQALQHNDLSTLKRITGGIEKELRKRDSRRKRSANALLTTLRKWIASLRPLTKDDFDLNNLDAINQRSEGAVEHFHDIPPLINSVVRLQSELIDHIERPQVEAIHSETLSDDELSRLLAKVSQELLELIGTLHMPASRKRTAQQLAKKLEQGININQLPDVVLRIIQLVNTSCSHLNEEFENYLRQVSGELVGMHAELSEQQDLFTQSGEEQLKLSHQVATQVETIQQTTQKASSLSALKDIVKSQIGHVQHQVQELRTTEKARIEVAEERYKTLSNKVKAAEHEAKRTQQKVEEERVRSRLDQLTRLPNRLAYDEKLLRCMDVAKNNQLPLCLAVCDIDHFKRINDTYGHLTGDKALKLIGRVLQDALRASDFVSRFGGEEFAIILQDTDLKAAEQVLDVVRSAIELSPFNFSGKPIPITVSFGVAQYQLSDDSESFFSLADKALYQAKNNGRNQVCGLTADAASE